MTDKFWKKFDSSKYFEKINIPDNWDTLEDFVEWFLDSRMPMMIPYNAEVIRSDDACAICIFRKGQYQVEFYLEYPEMYIREHSHPRMEVITMQLGGGSLNPPQENGTSIIWGEASHKLLPGESHGGDLGNVIGNGFITLAFQKWDNPEEMTSAAVQWKGELQGPIQYQLIKNKKSNAHLTPNYADVTDSDTK